ncbi:MAG: hypothetical protein EXR93_02950 [Gemmatimonadetes bacterium]|nr:hypothetical protein [Gemmatimonadota bacterium]
MPKEVAILFALTIGASTLVSLAWIVTRYLERKHQRRDPAEDVATQDQLEDMRGWLEAVEERLEFAERFLAKQRERPALGGER